MRKGWALSSANCKTRFVAAVYFLCCIAALLPTTAAYGTEESADESLYKEELDPFQPINRKIYLVNEALDRALLKPVAKGYRAATPSFVDHGITNFFNNLRMVPSVINNVLVLKFDAAFRDAGKFLVNSTVGLLGFVNVAGKAGFYTTPNDFGQTLATWGVTEGPYIVLPVFGGFTVRSAVGFGVDGYLYPVKYVDDDPTRLGLRVVDFVDQRANVLDLEQVMTGDRYIFLRDTYLQQRRYLEGGSSHQEMLEDSGFSEDYWEEDQDL